MIETSPKNTKQNSRKKQIVESSPGNYFPVICVLLSIILFFSFYSFDEGEYGTKNNLFGIVGHYISKAGYYLFGRSIYILPAIGFISGVILFQKKDTNRKKLFLSVPFLIISISIFLNITGANNNSLRGNGGNKIGELISVFLELVLGKSGRVLTALALSFYGLLLILRESPRKIDLEFWKAAFIKVKEKMLKSVASEIEHNEETESIKGDEVPWIEVKRVSKVKRLPQIEDFSSSENVEDNYQPINLTQKDLFKEDYVKNEADFNRISELKESINKVKRQIDLGSKLNAIEIESSEEFIEPEIFFREASRDLKSKIYKSPIPISLSEDGFYENDEEDRQVLSELWEKDPEITETLNDSVNEEELSELFSMKESEESDSILPLEENVEENLNEPEEYYSEPVVQQMDFPKEVERDSRLPFGSMVPQVTFLRKALYKIPIKLFSSNPQKRTDPMYKLEAEYIAKKIIEIIRDYGLESKMMHYQKGPIVTRFELAPPPGVKLTRITSLSDELRLYLAVKSIRIVAPIPGKSTIGIEVPNKYREDVLLGDIIRERGEDISSNDLTIVIGKDSISGEIVTIDLNKLPHLLVAGTTGSGKSVAMNAMISYLIYSKSPDEVRFIMIDPKMVEMTLYEDIPHLLLPVITDPRKATKALYWAVQEMESRYALMSDLKCRDIRAYNEKVSSSLIARIRHKKMPYIVIFIDELSDLMMVSGKELEDYITRISQKARAVGIHLVMATQRPSVDVITGLIKTNCPARIAFHVAQKTDSKIILDYSGADALLGKGDFLYKSPTSPDLQRIQAPYVTEQEIEKIVQESMTYAKAEYVSMNLDEESFKEESNDADEESFEEAWNIVKTERKASASYLQRRLRIGYNKAARLMELMEERGYVGPQIGAKPRDILK
jgi:DNA segregation ATPase FtsK/SpoIIIE, S-DNA-T family